MTTNTIAKLGDVLEGGSNELRHLTPGTVLIEAGTLTKRIKAEGGMWFVGGGDGWSGEFIVVSVPAPPVVEPDLTDRIALATELRRKRMDDPIAELTGWSTEYLRVADFVLENFTANASVPPREGDRVIVVSGGYKRGMVGTVSEGPDEDREYYIEFDADGYKSYVHEQHVKRV